MLDRGFLTIYGFDRFRPTVMMLYDVSCTTAHFRSFLKFYPDLLIRGTVPYRARRIREASPALADDTLVDG